MIIVCFEQFNKLVLNLSERISMTDVDVMIVEEIENVVISKVRTKIAVTDPTEIDIEVEVGKCNSF